MLLLRDKDLMPEFCKARSIQNDDEWGCVLIQLINIRRAVHPPSIACWSEAGPGHPPRWVPLSLQDSRMNAVIAPEESLEEIA